MIRHIIDSRLYLTLILTVGSGTVLLQHFPFAVRSCQALVLSRLAAHRA